MDQAVGARKGRAMTEDDIEEVADRLSDVLVNVPTTDPKAMASLCDWFCSLKSSHLTDRRHKIVGIIEAVARVLENMREQNPNCGVKHFNSIVCDVERCGLLAEAAAATTRTGSSGC